MPSLFALPLAGLALAIYLRWAGLRWTWSLAGTLLAWPVPPLAATCAVATLIGARWHRADLNDGGDLARRAAARRGPLDAARAQLSRRRPTVDARRTARSTPERPCSSSASLRPRGPT